MNSGRITIGLLIILAFSIMFMVKTTTLPNAYAATNANQSTTASVTVNGFVSTTLYNTPINFPAVDPGANDTQATALQGAPLSIQVDNATTVDVMGYLNGSIFNSTAGTFTVGNMSMNMTGNATIFNTSCTTSRCRYTTNPSWIFNETAPAGTGHKSERLWHHLDVPTAQAPGGYASNVRICVMQISATPTACN